MSLQCLARIDCKPYGFSSPSSVSRPPIDKALSTHEMISKNAKTMDSSLNDSTREGKQ